LALNPALASGQNTGTALQQLVADVSAQGTTPVSAVAQSATQSSLPVWQADPLPAQSQHWGQRLVQLLADKVDLQLGLNVNKAMIRLDPPSLGSIELSVQLDGDRLTVQMHSSNAQLRDAMGQGLELLRASLQQKLGSEVQIDLRMGSESSSQQQQQHAGQQFAQQTEANFYPEAELTVTETSQPNRLNLVNQLV
jgi:flagellar hook-length control protein FliK